jgi:hypothetical protein
VCCVTLKTRGKYNKKYEVGRSKRERERERERKRKMAGSVSGKSVE